MIGREGQEQAAEHVPREASGLRLTAFYHALEHQRRVSTPTLTLCRLLTYCTLLNAAARDYMCPGSVYPTLSMSLCSALRDANARDVTRSARA